MDHKRAGSARGDRVGFDPRVRLEFRDKTALSATLQNVADGR
jgi:hypothetical protein